MKSWKINHGQTAKERLETGFNVLQTVLVYRSRTGSAGLGWGIERAIVDRELDELEEDLRVNPPVREQPDGLRPSRLSIEPLPLPSLRPYLKNRLKPLVQPHDPATDNPDWTNA